MSVATVRVAETLGTGFAFAPTKYGREDDRLPNELRPIKFKLGNLSRADGSVRYLQGKTSLLVAVHGPVAVEASKEDIQNAIVEVTFRFRTSTIAQGSQPQPLEYEYAQVIRDAMESIIITSLHPRTKILIAVQVLEEDGSVLAAALNAAMLAVLASGLRCRTVLTAVSMAITNKSSGHDDNMEAGPQIILDPTLKEEQASKSKATMAFSCAGKLYILPSKPQGMTPSAALTPSKEPVQLRLESKSEDSDRESEPTGVSVPEVITVKVSGPWTQDQVEQAHDHAKIATNTIADYFKSELSEKP